ncbi:MAG: hypothetical protein GC179_11360 [Anaerolineaceae bacterium]|nr:hypothetical protein [Anaerolineaceae bacterium]
MNGWRLFRWILWRGIFSGVVLGALFGMTITSIYTLTGAIGICFIGFFAGALLGGLLGGIVSTMNGIALVILTRFFPHPLNVKRRYRWSTLLVSLITTAVSTVIAVNLLFGDLPFVLVPVTILAAIVAGYFSWRLPDADSTAYGSVHRPLANAVLFYVEK